MPSEQPTIFIYNQWARDPNGPFLDKRKAPIGKRTPNGMIWGHSINDFFWIERQSGMRVMTVWSRSMIQEFGENYANEEHDPEPEPRLMRPWPLLKLKMPKHLQPENDLGIIDEGCSYYDDGCYERIIDPDENINQESVTLAGLEANANTYRTIMVLDEVSKSKDGTTTLEDVPGSTDLDNTNISPNDDDSYRAHKRNLDSLKVKGLPPAPEEFIPPQYFPDVLLVKGSDQMAVANSYSALDADVRSTLAENWIKFNRVLLAPSSPDTDTDASNGFSTSASLDDKSEKSRQTEPRVAYMRLSAGGMLGVGHHSSVYLSALTLPRPLSARTLTGEVSVACKMSDPDSEAREHLENEANIYASFPKHLQEDWCGLNMMPPIKTPVPACAVVPKFYGYYKPVFDEEAFGSENEEVRAAMKTFIERLSPILLMEHCGIPIVTSKDFHVDKKILCYSMIRRLHINDYIHNSFYQRNVLVQPGPLTRPPEERSMKTPSYRVIDFGRSELYDPSKDKMSEYDAVWGNELHRATGELNMEPFVD